MKKNIILLFCLVFSGCMPLIIGASALGGYAISKDTIQGEVDNTFNTAWDAAIRVADIMGVIKVEDKEKGAIALTIGSNNVNIKVIDLTRATSRLRVSARTRYLIPNITLAQKVFIKIIQQLAK